MHLATASPSHGTSVAVTLYLVGQLPRHGGTHPGAPPAAPPGAPPQGLGTDVLIGELPPNVELEAVGVVSLSWEKAKGVHGRVPLVTSWLHFS